MATRALAVCLSGAAGCIFLCDVDESHSAAFAPYLGHEFVLTRNARIMGVYYFVHLEVETSELAETGRNVGWVDNLPILRAGTRIRFTKRVWESCEKGTDTDYFDVLSGPYRGDTGQSLTITSSTMIKSIAP